MSIKIYDGYYINKNISSIYEIKQKLFKIQNEISYYILNDIKNKYKNESKDFLFSLAGKFQNDIETNSGIFFNIYGVNLVILPLENINLCLLYTCSEEIKKIFLKDNFLNSYFYYNNNDKPVNISNKEWLKRKNDWEKAFSQSLTPSLSGFQFQLIDSSLLFLNINNIKK